MNIDKLVRQNILNLKPYSSARDEFKGSEGMFFDANENPYGKLNRYPDPYQNDLKNKLSQLKNIAIENIFIGNGSDEIIDLTFRVFCEPGKDKALTFSPSYGMYEVSANINNVELIKVPLKWDFQLDIEEIDTYLHDENLKVIFLCSPNNPTGNLLNFKDIEYILKKFQGILILDEAYIDFANTESCLSKIDQFPNLLVSQTFSKAWGLAAARVGVAYANKQIVQYLNKVKPPYNVSQINQQAAIKALENIEDFETKKTDILKEKDKLISALQKMDIIQRIYPSDTNFILIQVENANKLYDDLVDKEIIVRNRDKLVRNCIRITVGTAEENQFLIKAMNQL